MTASNFSEELRPIKISRGYVQNGDYVELKNTVEIKFNRIPTDEEFQKIIDGVHLIGSTKLVKAWLELF